MAIRRTRIRQSPKLPPQQRRRQLLKAAGELFLKKGYRDTTVDEIAERAGLTKGALYFHFASKEEILLQLIKATIDRHHEIVMTRLDRGPVSPGKVLRTHLELHLNCKSRREMEMIDTWNQAWHIPRIRRYIVRRSRQALQEYAARLDPTCLKDRVDAGTVMTFILALTHGLSCLQVIAPGAVDYEAQVRLFDRLFSGLKVSAGRRRRKGKS